MCHQDIRTNKAGHLGKDLPEPRAAGDHISGDAMDLDVAGIEVVEALRRTHQPGGFFHHLPVTDLHHEGVGVRRRAPQGERTLVVAEQTMAQGNLPAAQTELEKVAVRYPKTAAGVEASMMLAQMANTHYAYTDLLHEKLTSCLSADVSWELIGNMRHLTCAWDRIVCRLTPSLLGVTSTNRVLLFAENWHRRIYPAYSLINPAGFPH